MIGSELAKVMRKEGMSQKALAKSLGVSQVTVSKYTRAANLTYPTVEKVLSILGYDIRWVKRGVDEEKVSALPNPLMDVPGAEKLTMDDLALIRMMAAGLVAQKGNMH